MLIIGADELDIRFALGEANHLFDDNLQFRKLEPAGKTRDGRAKFTVTLTVKDSKKIGSRRNYEGGRIAAACWHAHGTFFDALPKGTEIQTSANATRMQAGDPWQDYEIGSQAFPLRASDACNC